MSFFIEQFTHILISLYTVVGDLGLTIIVFTILIRSLLLPITLPSLKSQKKIRSLQPELNKLKKKHGKDKKALQEAQMDLYKRYNVNPLGGCIPQLVQLGVLIVLYQALITFLGNGEFNGIAVDPSFLWLNLSIPDSKYILPVLAGGSQLILSLMIAPGAETLDIVPNQSKKKKIQEANKKEEDVADMAASMQQQMIFMMPLMTGFFATRFPSGLALYWVITTLYSIVQQYFISGPGGLVTYTQRIQAFINKKS